MGTAAVIVFLVVLVTAVVACSGGAAVWAYRRVLPDYPTGTAVVAAAAVWFVTFSGGWIIFAPCWGAGWLRRRLRPHSRPDRTGRPILVLLSFVGLAIVLLGVMGVLQDRTETRRTEALQARGVMTAAEVLTAHFDANGGDPGGWTSVRARFTDAAGRGRSHVVTVGHHYEPTEHSGEPIAIIYDSSQPGLADLVAERRYVRTDAESAVISFGMTIVGAVFAGVFAVLARRRRRTNPGTQKTDSQEIPV